MNGSVNIIGAGIGGLTTALILKQRGLKATIFESSTAIKPVGAGIILANNAMQVFKQLGLQDQIETAGNRISAMNITNSQLKVLSKADLSRYEQKYGVCHVAIHRGKLQQILADELEGDQLRLSKRLTKIEKTDRFKLTFEDQSVTESEIVIGADGIRSVVRNQLFKENTLRNANQICWRGICQLDLPENYHHELNEAWGKGKRFGFVKISENQVYWYALANSTIGNSATVDLKALFSEFHPDILNIISSIMREQMIVTDIIDLKPAQLWQNGNSCLIGDAAHATTPNLGQGACQAIEDAYVLGKLLDQGLPIEHTFLPYQKLRKKKAHMIVNTSWNLGKLAHLESNIGIWLRNFMMKRMPKSINRRQLDLIFDLN